MRNRVMKWGFQRELQAEATREGDSDGLQSLLICSSCEVILDVDMSEMGEEASLQRIPRMAMAVGEALRLQSMCTACAEGG